MDLDETTNPKMKNSSPLMNPTQKDKEYPSSAQKFHKPRAQNSDDNHRKTASESKLPSKKRRYSPHVPVLKKQKVVLNRETLDDTEYDATEETVPFTGGAEADDLPEYTPRKRATKFDDEVEPLYEDRDEIVNVVPPFPAEVIET
ncbi:hypothetical protein PRIC1_003254 [Phytophthora ramorum]